MLVSDRLLEIAASRGDDEAGTDPICQLSETSRKLDTCRLHVLEVRRIVDMSHYVDVPELDRKFNAKLHFVIPR